MCPGFLIQKTVQVHVQAGAQIGGGEILQVFVVLLLQSKKIEELVKRDLRRSSIRQVCCWKRSIRFYSMLCYHKIVVIGEAHLDSLQPGGLKSTIHWTLSSLSE